MAEKKKTAKKKKTLKFKGQESIIRVVKALSVVIIILILLFVAADRFGNITFSSVGDYFSAAVSGVKQGDGYPYYFESVTPESVHKMNSDLLVLNDDSVFVLDSTARKLSTIKHTYSVPLVSCSNGRAILFDVGGNNYQVLSKTKVLYENTTTEKILTAAIGKDGTVAVATRGESSQSLLMVFNKNQKKVFEWACAKDNIVSVAVSDNGKYVAVSVLGAENGELVSRVLMFDFDYQQAVAEFNYGDKVVSSVSFISGKMIVASGERVLSYIKDSTEKTDVDLTLNTLSRISQGDNNITAAIFSKYGSSSAKILKAYSSRGKELFTVEINSAVRAVSCEGNYISVLTDHQLINYSKSGKVIGTADVTSDGISCFTDGNKTYVLTTSGINEFRTTATTETETTSFEAVTD